MNLVSKEMKEDGYLTAKDIVLSKPGARRYKPHPLEKSKKLEDTQCAVVAVNSKIL